MNPFCRLPSYFFKYCIKISGTYGKYKCIVKIPKNRIQVGSSLALFPLQSWIKRFCTLPAYFYITITIIYIIESEQKHCLGLWWSTFNSIIWRGMTGFSKSWKILESTLFCSTRLTSNLIDFWTFSILCIKIYTAFRSQVFSSFHSCSFHENYHCLMIINIVFTYRLTYFIWITNIFFVSRLSGQE